MNRRALRRGEHYRCGQDPVVLVFDQPFDYEHEDPETVWVIGYEGGSVMLPGRPYPSGQGPTRKDWPVAIIDRDEPIGSFGPRLRLARPRELHPLDETGTLRWFKHGNTGDYSAVTDTMVFTAERLPQAAPPPPAALIYRLVVRERHARGAPEEPTVLASALTLAQCKALAVKPARGMNVQVPPTKLTPELLTRLRQDAAGSLPPR